MTRLFRIPLPAIFLVLLSLVVGFPATAEPDLGDNRSETLTGAAWEAYEHQGYDDALAIIDTCIKLYGEEARQMQESLTAFPATEPKEETAKYWALNDVGTCLFIRGEILMKQGKNDEAKAAFTELLEKYRYAQCWDKQGWYWKPAQAAKQKLVELEFEDE